MKPGARIDVRDEEDVVARLESEAGLSREDAALYLGLLRRGYISGADSAKAAGLVERGMAIVSGDGKRIIPVHPRLGVANQFRTWREALVREINERRTRVDKLIIELIPLYEAATEKNMGNGSE